MTNQEFLYQRLSVIITNLHAKLQALARRFKRKPYSIRRCINPTLDGAFKRLIKINTSHIDAFDMKRFNCAADFACFASLKRLSLKRALADSVHFETDSGLPLIVTSPTPGVFRLQFAPAEESLDSLIVQQEAEPMTVESFSEGFLLKTFFTELRLSTKPLQIALTHRMRLRLSSVLAEAASKSSLPTVGFHPSSRSWAVSFALKDEPVYGLGQASAGLNRKGQQIDGDLPFCWSPQGWGVMVLAAPGTVRHHVMEDGISSDHYLLHAQTKGLDLFLFAGTPAEMINAFTNLTGKPNVPPIWSLGSWIGQAPEANSHQILSCAHSLRAQGISADVIAADSASPLSMETRMSFESQADYFAESKKMLTKLQEMQWHFSATEHAFIRANSAAFEEMAAKGWLLKNAQGKAASVAFEGDFFGIVDFTHPEAFNFWKERHEPFFKEGVDAFNTAVTLPEALDLQAYDGSRGAKLNCLWSLLFNRAVFEATQKFHGEGIDKRALVVGKGRFWGSQSYPLQYSGQTISKWEHLTAAVYTAQSLGATAQPSYPVLIGDNTSQQVEDTEFYARAVAASVFFSHLGFTDVGENGFLAYEPEIQTIVKKWLKFRYRLIPYVLGALEEASRNGLPVVRSMALAFPEDKFAHTQELQYLFGPALLVAPIVEPGGKRQVYFPKGERWYDLATGVKYEGGTLYEFEKPLDGAPVFGREGYILCLGPEAQSTYEINTIRPITEAWLFGLPAVDPCVTAVKIKVMQMQGNAYIKGLEGTKILAAGGYEVSRRGAEVKIVKKR